MDRREFLKLSGAGAMAAVVGAQSTTEAPILSLPEWANTGSWAQMGLDGGPLEAEKGLRSGWEYFTRDDPQGVLQAVRDFYRPENVEIPATAGVNWVFVTWTNGWSKETERERQWTVTSQYMEACRRRGIRSSVYISGANMFWEDYVERVPESRKWIESVPPGGIRHYGGSLYRVMANLRLKEWRAQIKIALDAALDAGAEGVWLDNLFWWHGRELFTDFIRDLQTHVARRKKEFAWHININRGIYNWGRVGNVVGCEDGRAPRFEAGADPQIAGNLGLLSFVSGLTEGWRSAQIEHYGNKLPAAMRQLMIAECWLWGVGCTWFPVDRLQQAQFHRREPAAWKVLEAIGLYNRHQLKHRELFQRGEPIASVGVIGHPGSSGSTVEVQDRTQRGQTDMIALLDRLAAWKVQYEVLFEDRLSAEKLRNFAVVVLADPDHTPPGAIAGVSAYLAAGGTVLLPEGAALPAAEKKIELPKSAFQAKSPGMTALRDEILRRQAPPVIELQGPAHVVYRAVRQQGRTLVHLVNYRMESTGPVSLAYRGPARRMQMLTPEDGRLANIPLRQESGRTIASIPEFPIHAVVVVES